MASVSIEFSSFDDTVDVRFKKLGRQIGLDRDLALIKCARVWKYCIEHNTYRLKQDDIDLIVDIDHFGEAMLRCDLASDKDDKGKLIGGGLLEIKGTKGRIEYLAKARARQQAATEAARLAAEERRKQKSNLGSEVGSNLGTEDGSDTLSETPSDTPSNTPSETPSSSSSSYSSFSSSSDSDSKKTNSNPTELIKKGESGRVGDNSHDPPENSADADDDTKISDPVLEVINRTIDKGRTTAAIGMIRALPVRKQAHYRDFLEKHDPGGRTFA